MPRTPRELRDAFLELWSDARDARPYNDRKWGLMATGLDTVFFPGDERAPVADPALAGF